MVADRDVGVGYDGGGDEDGATCRKPYDKAKVPKDEMPAMVRVKPTQRGNRAPAGCEVLVVDVGPGRRVGPKVEGRGAEDSLGEGADEGWAPREEQVGLLAVEAEKIVGEAFEEA